MGTTTHWAALLTLATLALLFGCVWYVGAARGKYKVAAPATTGPEPFERAFRVQMNTLENAVLFLPALWLATLYFSPRIAAGARRGVGRGAHLVRVRLCAQPQVTRRAVCRRVCRLGSADGAGGVGRAHLAALVSRRWPTQSPLPSA